MLWLNVTPGIVRRCTDRQICLFVMNPAVVGHWYWMMRLLRRLWRKTTVKTAPQREGVEFKQVGTTQTVGSQHTTMIECLFLVALSVPLTSEEKCFLYDTAKHERYWFPEPVSVPYTSRPFLPCKLYSVSGGVVCKWDTLSRYQRAKRPWVSRDPIRRLEWEILCYLPLRNLRKLITIPGQPTLCKYFSNEADLLQSHTESFVSKSPNPGHCAVIGTLAKCSLLPMGSVWGLTVCEICCLFFF